ncbi:Hsp20/alpha crystallin family protein [Candidatus Bathyarchaeota archaeon]|nr:Hsp20/alpha crystallin family protein [Candidatus Bathyarchaeota archaeon]
MSERKGKVQTRVKPKVERGEIVPTRPSDILSEVDKMFNELRKGIESIISPIRTGWPRLGLPRFELPEVREPCLDLVDAGREYRVCAEVPGIPKEKIEVTVTPRAVEISGEAKTEVKEEGEGYIHQERGYSRVYRSLTLPEEVLPEKAEATLNNGLLEIKIPKKSPTEVKKHKIPVK